jgi:glycosyltransferase involved in cell wall biosynthesis
MGGDWSNREGLLFVGRLVSMKGADVAVETTRLLTERGVNTTLTICGDGPERPNLQKQVEKGGIGNRVSFYGWTEPEELACLYSQKKALLFPTKDEGFGIVALEAIACGCPIVGSKVGGVPDAVGNCGVLVPPDDAQAHAAVAEKVLQRKTWTELRSAMPDHMERHRIDHIAEEYLDVIEEAAHEA